MEIGKWLRGIDHLIEELLVFNLMKEFFLYTCFWRFALNKAFQEVYMLMLDMEVVAVVVLGCSYGGLEVHWHSAFYSSITGVEMNQLILIGSMVWVYDVVESYNFIVELVDYFKADDDLKYHKKA
jgi:hypothetical protein